MTKLERLVALFGSQQKLAEAIGMTRGRVSQWLQYHKHHRDTLPPHLNDRVRRTAAEMGVDVNELLEDACPMCHRPY